MAVIEKIRNRSGLLIGVIAIALISFLVGDAMFSRNSLFGGGPSNVVGEIGGDDITITEYENQVKVQEGRYRLNYNNMEPDAQAKDMFEETAWQILVRDNLLNKEFDKLGINVSESEMGYITWGDAPHQRIIDNFKDPKTGAFNKDMLINFLRNKDQDEKASQQWAVFEQELASQVRYEKYFSMLRGGIYRTKLEAKEKFLDRNRLATAHSVGLNYGIIADSSIKYTDADLQEYLDKNADKYKRKEEGRDIEYISLDVVPASVDSANAFNWINEKAQAFATTESDSAFVDLNSETPFDTLYKGKGSFPPEMSDIEDSLFFAQKGKMVGPVLKNGGYVVYKLTDVKEDSVYTMKASHIIIPPQGTTAADTMAAYNRLVKVMQMIRSGKDFAQVARDSSQDGAASRGGDLGWFREGQQMVKEFSDAVKAHNKGDVYMAKTPFGWHVIKNTEDKYKRLVRVSVLNKSIIVGKSTTSDLYNRASTFASKVASGQDFEKAAEEMKLVKRVYNDMKSSDKKLPGINSAKSFVSWAYNDDRKEGDVSNVLTLEDKYVVAKLVAIKKEGKPKLADVKKQLEIDYIKHRKAQMLTDRFKEALPKSKTIQELAINLKSIAQDVMNQNFEQGSLPNVGYEPKVVGAMFGSPAGKFSKPIEGENGVYVLWVEKITEPAEQKDYKAFGDEITNDVKGRVDGDVMKALEDRAKVKDLRYRMYN